MKTRTAARLAAILAAVLLSTSAEAQTVFQNGFAPAPDAYANLPGVKDLERSNPRSVITAIANWEVTDIHVGPTGPSSAVADFPSGLPLHR